MTSLSYVQDIEKWKTHFLAMARGRAKPMHNGLYSVGDTINQKGGHPQIKVELVTPVAAATERAKAQLEREEEEDFYKEPTVARRNNKRKRI
jgi:hypothetical protein